jgi:DNA-binding response OmpR family regulator
LLPGEVVSFSLERGDAQRNARSRLRFLVVEDDALFARTLARCLATFGDVIVVGSVREALRTCQKVGDWSAFILDIRLPDGSGVKLLEELRGPWPQVPALIITNLLGKTADAGLLEAANRLLRELHALNG